MKQSLWDLKLALSPCPLSRLRDHEAVPMGFETSENVAFPDLHMIMKQSLWDLKQHFPLPVVIQRSIMKQSLWDLKRPSRTQADLDQLS